MDNHMHKNIYLNEFFCLDMAKLCYISSFAYTHDKTRTTPLVRLLMLYFAFFFYANVKSLCLRG